MTLNKLIAQLLKLQAAGHGRCRVNVDKGTLWDGNGTFQCCDIEKAECTIIPIVDGDGFHIENKDGTEKSLRVILLSGGD